MLRSIDWKVSETNSPCNKSEPSKDAHRKVQSCIVILPKKTAETKIGLLLKFTFIMRYFLSFRNIIPRALILISKTAVFSIFTFIFNIFSQILVPYLMECPVNYLGQINQNTVFRAFLWYTLQQSGRIQWIHSFNWCFYLIEARP